ncbi:probable serine/threonine-protein kinase DDB_G0277449 [Rana temporaria]|nr:probable serine/threonine-protein kinase DDB_G0277449 [Rana temporaria]
MATGAEAESAKCRNSLYPNNIDPDLRDVIERLLEENPKVRGTAVERLREHSFFRSIEWKKLEEGKVTPPLWMPDCQEKDTNDTNEQIEVKKLIHHRRKKQRRIANAKQRLFDGFSFISRKWKKDAEQEMKE